MTVTEQDRKHGLEIADQLERVYVAKGQIRPMIGEEIAKAIALGRQQGLELAATQMERELAAVARRIRSGQISN